MITSKSHQADIQLPDVPGTRKHPVRGDAWRYFIFNVRGFAYSVRHGSLRSRVVGALMLTVPPVAVVFLSIALVELLLRGETLQAIAPAAGLAVISGVGLTYPVIRLASRTTICWSDDNNTLLAISRSGDGLKWTLKDHITRHPGTGAGAHLRGLLYEPLMEIADRRGVTICAKPADPKLGAQYRRSLDGFEDRGRAWPRGRKLVRPPQAPSARKPTRDH